jgi:hypothetical protein
VSPDGGSDSLSCKGGVVNNGLIASSRASLTQSRRGEVRRGALSLKQTARSQAYAMRASNLPPSNPVNTKPAAGITFAYVLVIKRCSALDCGMSLRLRQTELGSPIHKDAGDFAVFSGEWAMGRIYQFHGGPEPLRWSWSLYGILGKPQGLRSDGRAPTLEAARTQLEASWRQWLDWAQLREIQ